jgi:ADP-ribose pyrophosphatase
MPNHTRPTVGVGAVVFKDEAVLLVKRKNPPCENEWAIPGGKVRLGETLQQAAEREIQEETGITIKAGSPVFSFDLIEHNSNGEISFHYVIIDLEGTYISGEPIANDDALEVCWSSKDSIQNLNINNTTRELLHKKYHFTS